MQKQLKAEAVVSANGKLIFTLSDVAKLVDKDSVSRALYAINRLAGIERRPKATGLRIYTIRHHSELVAKANKVADEDKVVGRRRVTVHNAVRSKQYNNLAKELRRTYELEAKRVNEVIDEQMNLDADKLEIYQ